MNGSSSKRILIYSLSIALGGKERPNKTQASVQDWTLFFDKNTREFELVGVV